MNTSELAPWIPWLIVVCGPVLLIATTCFAKINILLAALRLGLGAESLLPWTVLSTLALLLTGVIMEPVAESLVGELTALNWEGSSLTNLGPLRDAAAPLLEFCARHADPVELELVAGIRGSAIDQPWIVVTAFFLTELREGLVMAAYLLVPFIVVELVLVQVGQAAALPAQSTATLAIPLKIGLFLAIGGWGALVQIIVEGYA